MSAPTVAQLIAKLQALPPDAPVYINEPAHCCCGECFCPHDNVRELDLNSAFVTDIYADGYNKPAVKGIEL